MKSKQLAMMLERLSLIVLLSLPAGTSVYAQTVEELLREADLTLHGKKVERPPKPRPKNATRSQLAPESPAMPGSSPALPEEIPPTEAKTHFNPTEAAQILRADLKAIQEEQTKRDPRVDFSILGGRIDFAPSFQLFKDDDTFQLRETARWTGASLEMSAGWTLFRFGQFGLLGLTAGSLGYYSGPGVISRTGVQTRTSEMYLMTAPMEVGAGFGISWDDKVQLIGRVGPSLNVINQRGQGTQDTLSGVFGGDYGVASLRARITSNWSLRADFRKQGITNRNMISESLVFGASYNLH